MYHERVAIFIDGAYLDKLMELEFDRTRIMFDRFVAAIAGTDAVLRTYYYHCPPYIGHAPTDNDNRRADAKDRFFSALSSLPRFRLRLGKLVYRGLDESNKPIFVQKLVDIMLGVDLVLLSATRQITKAVLVAGDSDFIPAVVAAKQQGVVVALWHGPTRTTNHSTVHKDLWDACDDRFEITQQLVDQVCNKRDNQNGQ